MILVTGGTGFIGQALVRHLLENGQEVRTMLRPSAQSPVLPTGMSVEVAISSINDERNLRAAVAGVDTIFHLIGAEWDGTGVDLGAVEIEGTKTLLSVSKEAGVKRIIYLSHLGADRASAFPVIKVKGIVEEFIRRSGLDYTIIRSGLVYGPDDHFTTALAKLMAVYPLLFFVPAPGTALVQPVWVEDLAVGMTWMLENQELVNETIELGGPEFLTIEEVAHMVMQAASMERWVVHLRSSYLRMLAVTLEYMYPDFPHSVYWLDYLANDRTTDIDSMSRILGLLPERMSSHLGYLSDVNWRKAARGDLRRKP